MKRKSEILHKALELEDSARFLETHRSPLNAQEARLKAEALRWVLGDQKSL